MNPDPDIAATAAGWIACREDGLDDAKQRQLQDWLAADPRHRAAFHRADAPHREVDWALHAGAVDEVLAGLEQRASTRRKRRRALATAGFTAAVALLVAGMVWRRADDNSQLASTAATRASVKILEPRRLALPDGSMAELRDGAEIAFDFSGPLRRVTLRRGAVHFQVAHDPAHPFVVSSGGVEIRAVGTAFSVQLDTKDVEVVVTEGRVAVARTAVPTAAIAAQTAPAAEPVLLDAGHGLVAAIAATSESAPEIRALPAAALPERLAWRVPRLEFAGTPLGEVVAVMNRHNRIQFVLTDPTLATIQLSGIVGADRIEALQDMLETGFPIRAERSGERILLRRAR